MTDSRENTSRTENNETESKEKRKRTLPNVLMNNQANRIFL